MGSLAIAVERRLKLPSDQDAPGRSFGKAERFLVAALLDPVGAPVPQVA